MATLLTAIHADADGFRSQVVDCYGKEIYALPCVHTIEANAAACARADAAELEHMARDLRSSYWSLIGDEARAAAEPSRESLAAWARLAVKAGLMAPWNGGLS